MVKRLEFVFLVLCISSLGFARDFYISTSLGSDARNITEAQSPLTPWQTISRVNILSASLLPGDQILFCEGEVFFGQVLVHDFFY